MATEHQGIKEEAEQTFSVAHCEAVHHKPVLCKPTTRNTQCSNTNV